MIVNTNFHVTMSKVSWWSPFSWRYFTFEVKQNQAVKIICSRVPASSLLEQSRAKQPQGGSYLFDSKRFFVSFKFPLQISNNIYTETKMANYTIKKLVIF